jgi:hypothetical protein
VIPDADLAGAVVAGGDRAVKIDVVERVVLDVDRLAVLLRILGDPVGDRPRGEYAVVLEAQVPMKSARVVLVHDEATAFLGFRRLLTRGFGRGVEAALVLVAGELL